MGVPVHEKLVGFCFVLHTTGKKTKKIYLTFAATDQENDLTAHLINKDCHPTVSPALSFHVSFSFCSFPQDPSCHWNVSLCALFLKDS